MRTSCRIILSLFFLLVALETVSAVDPVILVYGKGMPNFRDTVANVLRDDGRIDADVIGIGSVDCLSVALLFPNVKAAILVGQDATAVRGVEEQVIGYFEDGGGLVGFHDFANGEVSKPLSRQVFPLFANASRLGRIQEGELVQILYREQTNSINEGLPEELVFKDAEINLALNRGTMKWAEITPTCGQYTILYRDSFYNAPVVIAYRNEGASVTFAGGDITDSPENKYRYFGNLFHDTQFQELLVNSVLWAEENEMRSRGMIDSTLQELEMYAETQASLEDEVEKRRASSNMMRNIGRISVNVIGICAIALTYLKLVRNSEEDR